MISKGHTLQHIFSKFFFIEWEGMKENAIEMSPYNESVPADVRAAADAVKNGITDGSINPFSGPIKDQSGTERLAEGALTDGDLHKMDWYVEGVKS